MTNVVIQENDAGRSSWVSGYWVQLESSVLSGESKLSTGSWSYEEARRLLESWGSVNAELCVEDAYNASLTAGYRPRSASGNPLSFLRDFFKNEVLPCVRKERRFVLESIGVLVKRMREEGFCGPISQTVYVHAMVADALVKVLTTNSGMGFNTLSTADWVAIGVCFDMWLKQEESKPLADLAKEIADVMDNE